MPIMMERSSIVPGSERIAAIVIGAHTEKQRGSLWSPTQRNTVPFFLCPASITETRSPLASRM
jgi:hypothetical protein